MVDAAKDLTDALHHPTPSVPVHQLSAEKAESFQQLAKIFTIYAATLLRVATDISTASYQRGPSTSTQGRCPPRSKGGTATRSTNRGADCSPKGAHTNIYVNSAAPHASRRATTPVEQRPPPLGMP